MISISNSSLEENLDDQEISFQIDNQFLINNMKKHPPSFQFFKNFNTDEHNQLKSQWFNHLKLVKENIHFFDWFYHNIPREITYPPTKTFLLHQNIFLLNQSNIPQQPERSPYIIPRPKPIEPSKNAPHQDFVILKPLPPHQLAYSNSLDNNPFTSIPETNMVRINPGFIHPTLEEQITISTLQNEITDSKNEIKNLQTQLTRCHESAPDNTINILTHYTFKNGTLQ